MIRKQKQKGIIRGPITFCIQVFDLMTSMCKTSEKMEVDMREEVVCFVFRSWEHSPGILTMVKDKIHQHVLTDTLHQIGLG